VAIGCEGVEAQSSKEDPRSRGDAKIPEARLFFGDGSLQFEKSFLTSRRINWGGVAVLADSRTPTKNFHLERNGEPSAVRTEMTSECRIADAPDIRDGLGNDKRSGSVLPKCPARGAA